MVSVPKDPQQAAGAVLQAARAAFAARGYTHTTVKSVAAAAGVAPGVVTSLYRNKERLFAAATAGCVTAEWGLSENNRRARFYSLTGAGRTQLEAEVAKWERLSAGVNLVLERT